MTGRLEGRGSGKELGGVKEKTIIIRTDCMRKAFIFNRRKKNNNNGNLLLARISQNSVYAGLLIFNYVFNRK